MVYTPSQKSGFRSLTKNIEENIKIYKILNKYTMKSYLMVDLLILIWYCSWLIFISINLVNLQALTFDRLYISEKEGVSAEIV